MGPLSAQPAWSAWQPVVGLPTLSAKVLAETLDGGQAFRWRRLPDETWLGLWGNHVARLRLADQEKVEWCAPLALQASVQPALSRYLGVDRNFATLTDALPWRSDPHLERCVVDFPGLRILRQPFGETLLGFLCSATKQIVQIKQMIALLAERHGVAMPGGSATEETFCRLPTWEEIARVSETDLRACLLGFRARYISQTARYVADHPGWLEETEHLPYLEAKARLCSLPGVGEKVADCVLLFGAGRLEAFPVDVWILKTLARRYGLDDWRTPHLAQFGRVHFGPLAGLAQQFLFAWERQEARKRSDDASDHRRSRQ